MIFQIPVDSMMGSCPARLMCRSALEALRLFPVLVHDRVLVPWLHPASGPSPRPLTPTPLSERGGGRRDGLPGGALAMRMNGTEPGVLSPIPRRLILGLPDARQRQLQEQMPFRRTSDRSWKQCKSLSWISTHHDKYKIICQEKQRLGGTGCTDSSSLVVMKSSGFPLPLTARSPRAAAGVKRRRFPDEDPDAFAWPSHRLFLLAWI
jgi:hypothetical protein